MEKTHTVYSKKTKAMRSLLFLLLLVISLITLYPVIYIILGSFKANNELLLGGTDILPKTFIFDNYKQAWQKANFAVYTVNSLMISLGVMGLSILTTTMAGYVFARKKFKGKELLYSIFVAFMFVNVGSVSLRPLFELAGIALYVKTKNAKLKRFIRDSIPVGILGIGEPMMYAVTLPLGRSFITACIGAGFGGAVAALMHIGTVSQGVSGLFGLLIVQPGQQIGFIISMLIAYAGGFLVTYFFGVDEDRINEVYGE